MKRTEEHKAILGGARKCAGLTTGIDAHPERLGSHGGGGLRPGDENDVTQGKLDATRAASAARRPPEQRAILERANNDLRTSGILSKVATVGQMAPTFAAQNYYGRTISANALLANGPLVLSFFRGSW
jgi:hypothetical protein